MFSSLRSQLDVASSYILLDGADEDTPLGHYV